MACLDGISLGFPTLSQLRHHYILCLHAPMRPPHHYILWSTRSCGHFVHHHYILWLQRIDTQAIVDLPSWSANARAHPVAAWGLRRGNGHKIRRSGYHGHLNSRARVEAKDLGGGRKRTKALAIHCHALAKGSPDSGSVRQVQKRRLYRRCLPHPHPPSDSHKMMEAEALRAACLRHLPHCTRTHAIRADISPLVLYVHH